MAQPNPNYLRLPSTTERHYGGKKVAKTSPAYKKFMSKRMGAFKRGQMHSRKRRTGPLVKKRSQAVAIALSEARKKGLKGAPRAMGEVKGY